jgi:biopolymer transport protein ExbB
MSFVSSIVKSLFVLCSLVALTVTSWADAAKPWWKPEWTLRKSISIETKDLGADLAGRPTALLRLFDGNFVFTQAKEDGSDLRFVMEDDKTELPFHIERWDGLLNEALVWVKLPEVTAGTPVKFWLYYGNAAVSGRGDDAKQSFDTDTSLVYHFSEANAPAADATANGINADKAATSVPGALIAGGIRLTGQSPITIPNAAPLSWNAGGSATVTFWIKPANLAPNAVIFSRREAGNSFVIGLDNGVAYVEINGQRSAAGPPLVAAQWKHIAVVSTGATTNIYVDGVAAGSLAAGLPGLSSPILLGKDGDAAGYVGELDELQISKVARSVAWLKLAAVNQGVSPESAKLVVAGPDEVSGGGHEQSEMAKHLSLFVDISKSLTFDGWVVIALCAILALVGWTVAVAKYTYLNKIKKASEVFLQQWSQVSTDITALDHGDESSVKTLGGSTTGRQQKLMSQSPIFHLYHLGSQEIQHRIDGAVDGFKGLSGRSIAAIKAILDGGLVREVQRLNSKLVFLTISIAGGPYLGLLGTVIGVMITFAVIAQTGEVEINSIAPGIAGALLATVAGLAVAIPALFAYSYLSSRIKEAVNDMQIFIDEFIARIAEAYPTSNE